MPSSKTQFKACYDKSEVLREIVRFLNEHQYESQKLIDEPLSKIYDEVVKVSKINMPKFSTARVFIKEKLVKNRLLSKGEKINTEAAFRLTKLDIGYENLENLIVKNPGKLIKAGVIPCIIPLPSDDRLINMINASSQKKTTSKKSTSRLDLINEFCRKIKKQHKDVIIAAIPEANPIVTMNKKKNADYSPESFCSAICLFVKDNEKGKDFVASLKRKC